MDRSITDMIHRISSVVFKGRQDDTYTPVGADDTEWHPAGQIEGDEAKVIRDDRSDAYIKLYHAPKGGELPPRKHEEREAGIIVTGRCRIIVDGGDPVEYAISDAYNIAPGAWHSIEFLEDTIMLNMFHPSPNHH